MKGNSDPTKRTYDASVILVTHNQPQTLGPILKCLAAQHTLASYEVIVTDDGSNPRTGRFVNRFAGNASRPVRYIWQQHRRFRAGQARNNGIRLSNGKVLIFLDGDVIPPLDLIERHTIFHYLTDNLIVGGERLFCHGEDFEAKKPFASAPEILEAAASCARVNEEERMYRTKWLTSENPWKAGFSSHLSVKWAPDVYFDENLVGWGIEDWEFCYRLWKSGRAFRFYNNLLTYHINFSRATFNAFRLNRHEELVLFARNALYFIDKYPDDRTLRECTIAFRCYELDPATNRWRWDESKNYSVEEGIARLREWFQANPKAVPEIVLKQ